MDNNTAQAGNAPEYPREIYEPVLATSMELDEYLRQEFTINYFDLDGDHEVHTCYGDIKKTIDALMDYTNILDTVCGEWKLEGFQRAMYQYHSDTLRKFAGKLQAALGYDYAAILEKCRKKQNRKLKDKHEDIGADGITLAARRGRVSGKKETDSEETTGIKDTENGAPSDGGNEKGAPGGNGKTPDDNAEEAVCDRHHSRYEEHPKDGSAEKNSSISTEAEKKNASGSGSAAPGPLSPGAEPPTDAKSPLSLPEHSYKATLETIEGGTPMEKNELRTALEGHLDTLRRNLAVVSLEELKTKYKKPFDELRHNISATATAYVKQATLEGLRIRQDFLEEARPIIQDAIDQSGLLRQISEAAFRRQDMDEVDRLALDLKGRISLALAPFYESHIRLYMKKTPPGMQPPPAGFYNEATGCIWRDGAWVPMEIGRDAVLLPVQDIPKAAA